MDRHLGDFVQMMREVSVSAAHHIVNNDGIDLNAGYFWASVSKRSQHINAAARTNDRVLAVRAKYIGHRGGCRDQSSFPSCGTQVMRIDAHDGG